MGVVVLSHAAKHRATVEAGSYGQLPVSAPSRSQDRQGGIMQAALDVDKARLKQVRSRKRKAAVKAEIIPNYADYLQTIINGGSSTHNEVLVMICLWSLDAENFSYFITLARFALEQSMNAPEGFKRTLPEVLLEELAEKTIKHQQPELHLSYLQQLQHLTNKEDIADAVTAKFYKALGLALEPTDKAAALAVFHEARQYGAKVVRKINQLEKELRG